MTKPKTTPVILRKAGDDLSLQFIDLAKKATRHHPSGLSCRRLGLFGKRVGLRANHLGS